MKKLTIKAINFTSLHTPFNYIKCPEFLIMQYYYTKKGSPEYCVLTVVYPIDSVPLCTFDDSSNGEAVTLFRVWKHFNTCPRNDQSGIIKGFYRPLNKKYHKGGNHYIIPRNEMRVIVPKWLADLEVQS